MLQHLEKPASTRGTLLEAPCLAGASWLPLGQGFKGFIQKGKGQAAIHPLPCFVSLPGVPELVPWRQVSRIRSPPWLSALSSGLTLLRAGGRERVGAAFPSLSGLVPQEHRVQLLHRREFCFHLASELIQRVEGRISTEDSFVYQGEIQKPLKLFTAGWKNNMKNKHCADGYPDGFCRQISTPLAQLRLINIYLSSQDFISKIYKAPIYEGFREMRVIMPSLIPSWLCFVTELNLHGRAKWFKQLVQMTKRGMGEKV